VARQKVIGRGDGVRPAIGDVPGEPLESRVALPCGHDFGREVLPLRGGRAFFEVLNAELHNG